MFVFVWFSWWWWWWLLVCWTLSGSLFLFLSRLLLLSSSLFKLLLFPLSGSADKYLVSALVSYTDPMRILSEEGDGQSKKTMGNCCCLGSSFVFLPHPPSVIRTDPSGWDSLRLLISSFIHSEFRWSFSFPYYSFSYFLSWNNWRAH